MTEVIMVFSKFSKSHNHNYSYDVVYYNNALYAGINLFKNFINYLSGDKTFPVKKFSTPFEAEHYFNNIAF